MKYLIKNLSNHGVAGLLIMLGIQGIGHQKKNAIDLANAHDMGLGA